MNIQAAVLSKVLNWGLPLLWAWIAASLEAYLRQRKIDLEALGSVGPLKEARTGHEIDLASDSALDHW